MNKRLIYLAIAIGGLIGSYVPVWLFKVSEMSAWSILGSVVGGIAGIWLVYKYANDY